MLTWVRAYTWYMKPAISLITLGVDSIARSRAFYQALGWELSSASNDHVCFFQMNGTKLGLFGREALAEDAHVSPKGDGFRGVSLAMNLPSKADVDAAFAEALSTGATSVKKPEDVFWGGYSGYFADPDGHLWEVAWNPGFPLNEDGTIELP
jgi:uncharacterized protein